MQLGDRPVELGPRKQRAVLAMLALHVGRTVSADRLVEGLWGEDPPSSAPKMLQLYVSHLRRLLEGDGVRIVTRGRGYELQLPEGDVDAVRFEHLLEECRAREALALWRGEPLADVSDEPFAAAEIRRLEDLRLRAAEMAIDADLEAGRHAEVIGELDALVAQHPLRERLHSRRMLALYRSGRQSEALEAYRVARSALVEEIGVEPGAELRGLHDAILAQDPALDLSAPPAADEPEARPRAWLRPVLVVAAALLVAGVTAYGVIRVAEPDGLARIGENSIGLIEPGSGRIVTSYAVGGSPGAVAVGAGSVWVANRLDGTVSRIDRKRAPDAVVTIQVGGAPSALTFGAGALWVADGETREVAQVDPGSNKVLLRIPVGNAPRSLAAAAGALWAVSGVDGSVHRIDLYRGRVTRSIPLGAVPTAIVAGAGALWVSSEESGTVTRINPRSGTVVKAITVGNGPSALAAGEGAVWVVNRHDGTLSRIDPARNVVSGTEEIGGEPTAVAAGGGTVWVADGEGGTVARVDPEGPRLIEKVPTGSSPIALALSGGSLWTAAVAPRAAHRGGTLRVLASVQDERLPIDWITGAGYATTTIQLTSLVYDGLVGYRRVGGVGGATLVGALATSAPAPIRDGRTYVFTLRPGVHYSDGRLVQPEDFRASMERYLRLAPDVFPRYFAGIVGASRCTPARCDLSRGIETDGRARTIAVHLTRRDGEFLHKLTTTLAYVVPADTPVRGIGDHPPPGTGPYRVANWDRKRGGTFLRNPHFRSWSPEARPPGFADRIEVLGRPAEDGVERQIADVRRGRADLAVIANPFGSALGRERLTALAARSPGQLHSHPAPTTQWMFLNVRRRPFDDLGVRQALNFATDRARVAELAGGPEVAVPTCQIVPTALPGHEPYCPYTASPTARGGWTAPDMEQARRLVRASGRAGERVVVHVPPFRRPTGRYFVGLLDDLGFRASLARGYRGDSYFPSIQDPRSRAQIGFQGWALDYVTPSSAIDLSFSCSTHESDVEYNASRICDRPLTRQVDRALAAPAAESTRAWAAADRHVMDLAPAVAMTNHRSLVFTSQRTGNVQNHLMWFTLLDQLWVR